jgi:DNA primase
MNLPLGPARELGLLVAGDSGQFNDRFRDRITLPIMDLQGCPIGFAARALGNDKPAYLHSSKSPLFNLATDFYALELAYDAIRTSGTVLVVEGYFDVIRLHQGGFENAVAVLGTAVTEHHVRRLSGLAKRIVLVFGGDPTGRQAAGRVVELFRECELEPNVAFLGGDTDAETFLERWGASELRARIDSAVPCRR